MEATPSPDEIVLPALLRAARGAYARSIHRRLKAAGCDDVPRNGPFVLGGMVNHGGSAGTLIRELGITKQAASQVIDSLVTGGYLQRSEHAEDRRRVMIEITARGREAAEAVRAGVAEVDAELAVMITPAELAGLRAGLAALCAIRERADGDA